MIEYVLLNIEYWKNGKRHLLTISLIAAMCCGCAVGKSTNDANISAKEVNVPPQVTVPQAAKATPDSNEVDAILARLDQKSRQTKTYEAKIVYLYKQPTLESELLRSGMIYYVNNDTSSKLRINFTSLRQDNESVPKYREEYFFDGVTLTRVDHKLKQVEYRQLADANKPLNAFDLAGRYLPIVGFTKTDTLRDD
ncbi:MAG: hypothetical protein Q7T18_11400, partial [Sedimentisphaerales bacterium]|nr:hypothetical protein [Sedimentisphaerales bacterium]